MKENVRDESGEQPNGPRREFVQDVRGGQAACSTRRRLIQAIPLVATLPSGVALAQASSLNCVIDEQLAEPEGAAEAEGLVFTPKPDDDKYVRIPGLVQPYIVRNEPGDTPYELDVYTIPNVGPDADTLTLVGQSDNPAAPDAGSWFDPDDFDLALEFGSEVDAEFLYLYKVDSFPATSGSVNFTPSGVPDVPGKPSLCDIEPSIQWPDGAGIPDGPNEEKHCVFPVAVQVKESVGNVPLNGTCLTSLAAVNN